MAKHYVEVVAYEDGEVVKKIPCDGDEKYAAHVERGLNINLDHENYFTRVVSGEADA